MQTIHQFKDTNELQISSMYKIFSCFSQQNGINLIERAEGDEKRLYSENVAVINKAAGDVKKQKIPPPPILLCRTHNTMVLKPADFEPEDGENVSFKT